MFAEFVSCFAPFRAKETSNMWGRSRWVSLTLDFVSEGELCLVISGPGTPGSSIGRILDDVMEQNDGTARGPHCQASTYKHTQDAQFVLFL
jgi:hypothetical protein